MKVLIAEDDITSRQILAAVLAKWGYDVISVCDGNEAWEALRRTGAPKLVILDWIMPGMDGAEICRNLRTIETPQPPYVILLTSCDEKKDIAEGLGAGANDYVTKPFDNDELRARIEVGRRMVEMQSSLASRVKELQEALENINTLRGLMPICCQCKKVRDDQGYWEQVEVYVSKHSEAEFSHGFCPECYDKFCAENDIQDALCGE